MIKKEFHTRFEQKMLKWNSFDKIISKITIYECFELVYNKIVSAEYYWVWIKIIK